jgi:hypothetical protein
VGKKILWLIIALGLLFVVGWLLPMRSVSEVENGFKGPVGAPHVVGPSENPPY